MTKRIIRLFLAFIAFISLFFVARHFLVPNSFYDLGQYRADAVGEIESAALNYSDTSSCVKCHVATDSIHRIGAHSGITCQLCHGPGLKHVTNPTKYNIDKPSGRNLCAKCHSKNAARPDFIMQVDTAKHNKNMNCTKCHKPHNPSKKSISSDTKDTTTSSAGTGMTCVMCHDDMNILKSSGVHKTVLCQSCHGTGEKHMQDPAANLLNKPTTRAFCGSCHGIGMASATNGIKQVDLKEHNTDMKCIECHNAHSPYKDF